MRQPEAIPCRRARSLGQLGVGDLYILKRDLDCRRLQDNLPRHIRLVRVDRSQNFVSLDDILQGGPQRLHIQLAGKAKRDRNVVCGGRTLEAINEPQPPLCVRQWQDGRPRIRPKRLARLAFCAQLAGQAGSRGRIEDRPEGYLEIESGTDPVDQVHGQQRVPSQIEEAFIGCYVRQFQGCSE